LANIEFSHLFRAASGEQTINATQALGSHILTRADRRTAREPACYIERDTKAAGRSKALGSMTGQTAQHRDAPPTAWKQHHAGRFRIAAQDPSE
jgi:hypothetical protein